MSKEGKRGEKILKNSTSISGLLVVGALGYFVYGGLDGTFGMIILSALCSISLLISLIPYFGFFIQYLIVVTFIVPMVFEFTGLYHTWLTWLEIGLTMIIGLIITVAMTIYIMNENID